MSGRNKRLMKAIRQLEKKRRREYLRGLAKNAIRSLIRIVDEVDGVR